MKKIPQFIKDKITLNQKGDIGLKNKIEFVQNLKYEMNLNFQIGKITNYLYSFPNFGYGELALLCDKYGSDKGSLYFEQNKHIHPYHWYPHTYTDIYEVLFSPIRYSVRNVFECGIGSNDESVLSNMSAAGRPGASLRVWKDYFKNAQIWGADIDEKCLFTEDRINTGYIDQLSPDAIKNFFSHAKVSNFDIMIDDGLHEPEAAITLFQNSIEFLDPKGLYIIEDLSIDAIKELQEFFSPKEEFIVRYIFMDNGQFFDNNLVIISKKQ